MLGRARGEVLDGAPPEVLEETQTDLRTRQCQGNARLTCGHVNFKAMRSIEMRGVTILKVMLRIFYWSIERKGVIILQGMLRNFLIFTKVFQNRCRKKIHYNVYIHCACVT